MARATKLVSKWQLLIAADVARKIPSEPVQGICNRLNAEYGLAYNCKKHQKQLTRSTIYQAAKDGLAEMSPKKRGPPPKIPDTLMQTIASHAEVCQVGDGKIERKGFATFDWCIKIGNRLCQVYSVWRKVRKQYLQALQAAPKMTVEDGRAQWTTHDNLNQWFDNVKADLLSSGMVADEV
jgi:hypothetical protein